jgi:maleate cis-trans isomerase
VTIKPSPTVAAMAPYALPDISAAEGLQPIVLAQNEHAWPPSPQVQDAVRTAHTLAELLVISCTDYRALEAVPALERALGKPVITSNSGLMYACLTRLEIDMNSIGAGGHLFTCRN